MWDAHGHTAVFKMQNQEGPTADTGDSAQGYVAAWMGGGFGGDWARVCGGLSPFTLRLKLSQRC